MAGSGQGFTPVAFFLTERFVLLQAAFGLPTEPPPRQVLRDFIDVTHSITLILSETPARSLCCPVAKIFLALLVEAVSLQV